MDSPTKAASKNALKKQAKKERYERRKEERKAIRKEKRKQAKLEKKSKVDSGISKRLIKQRLQQALVDGVRLVVDLSFTDMMLPRDVGSLCRQLTIIYSENRKSEKPFHLYFTSLGGQFKEEFKKFSPDHEKWVMDQREESFLEVFQDEKEAIVYLTSDSDHDLIEETCTSDGQPATFKSNLILVIGGLIDRNRYKNHCLEKAASHGLKTAKLPLDLLDGANKGQKVLTTNQCAEMLLKYNETLDWPSAVWSIFPKRKIADEQRN